MDFFRKRNWKRFAKFCAVGFVNLAIDFLILNILSFIFGVHKGFDAAVLSSISFLFANSNSYFINKNWTFKDRNPKATYRMFLVVSLVGVVINASLVYFLTSHIAQSWFSDLVWLNISKLFAIFLVAFFNYFCYKKYVFNH